MVRPAAPKLEVRARGGERAAAAAAGVLGRRGRGGAGAGLGGGELGSRKAVLPRPGPPLGGAWGRGPCSTHGPSHWKDPNLLGESQPEGGALGASVRYPVQLRACAFLLLSRDGGVRASPGRRQPTPHFTGEETEAAQGLGLAQGHTARREEEGAEPRPRLPLAFSCKTSALRGSLATLWV